MPWFPLVPSAMAAADGGRIKKRAGLPKLLHKLFIKVLRLRPASSADGPGAVFEAYYGYRMGSDEYCYYYSYGGAGSSWAGVLSSIPEEEGSSEDDGSPDVVGPGGGAAAVLFKAKSERFVIGAPDAATVVHVEVLL